MQPRSYADIDSISAVFDEIAREREERALQQSTLQNHEMEQSGNLGNVEIEQILDSNK